MAYDPNNLSVLAYNNGFTLMTNRPHRARIATITALLDSPNQVEALWELRESLQQVRDARAKRAIRLFAYRKGGENNEQ